MHTYIYNLVNMHLLYNYQNIGDTGYRMTVSVYTHLISLNFVNQVAECWHAAEADHGFTLLSGQTFHFGQSCASQNNLFTTQVVLELRII